MQPLQVCPVSKWTSRMKAQVSHSRDLSTHSPAPPVKPCSGTKSLSHTQLFVTPGTVAHQAPLSFGFFRQEYWSALPFPPLGDLPDPGIKPTSPASPVVTGGFFTTRSPGKPMGLGGLQKRRANVPYIAGTVLSEEEEKYAGDMDRYDSHKCLEEAELWWAST